MKEVIAPHSSARLPEGVGRKNPKLLVYAVSRDPTRVREAEELAFLAARFRVVILTIPGAPRNRIGLHQVELRFPLWRPELARLWSRVAFLFARIANSLTDIEFPTRNLYFGVPAVRWAVNMLWRIKRRSTINRLLPSFENVLMFPLRMLPTRRRVRRRKNIRRVVLHDALLVRTSEVLPLLVSAKREGIPRVGVLKSWDNPFYSQLATTCNGYLVWGDNMEEDLRSVHGALDGRCIKWGARAFNDFAATVSRCRRVKKVCAPPVGVVGYAAAFCDTVLAEQEVRFLAHIAKILAANLPAFRLRVRPYPSISLSVYDHLGSLSNVDIVQIEGGVTDRFGDGREYIRNGSDEEKLEFLDGCVAFLSLATSFTIEAAIAATPIIHLRVSRMLEAVDGLTDIRERVRISDHIVKYFDSTLVGVDSIQELVGALGGLKCLRAKQESAAQELLRRIGVADLAEPRERTLERLERFVEELCEK